MKTIHLIYENDRGTIPPYFWRVEIVDECGHRTTVDPGLGDHSRGNRTTKDHAEDMVVDMVTKAGVKDTTDLDQWKAAGFDVVVHKPTTGFMNWPD